MAKIIYSLRIAFLVSLQFVLGIASVNSQVSYVVSGPISGQGPLLNNESTSLNTGWTKFHTAISGSGTGVNGWSAAQSIPFPFLFYGNPVTEFCVSKNYLLTFDVSVAGTAVNVALNSNSAMPNANLPDKTVAYFWGTFGNPAPIGTDDDVYYKVFGTAPNRQLWIKNFSFEHEMQLQSYNFVVLQESTNIIYVVDARWNSPFVGSYSVGVQKDASTAVEHASSPSISAIHSNIVTPWPNVDYYELRLTSTLANDAYIGSISQPFLPSCTSNSNVQVTLGNMGTNNLTSCTINWSVNGFVQTPLAWTGNIAQMNTQNAVTLGNYTFADGDVLQVWTSSPNGSADLNTNNDTVSMTLKFGRSGTYTIGGVSPNYATFNDAIADLENYGLCGPTVFEVRPGAYNEQLTLDAINGASTNNTITFRAANGDSTSVLLTYTGTNTTDNFVIKFNGGDHFIFDRLTLENPGSLYGTVLHFGGNSSYNTIKSCFIMSDKFSNSTSTNVSVIYSTTTIPSTDSYNTFKNNVIVGGSYGLYWYGETAIPYQEIGNKFINNRFEKNYYRATRIYYQRDVEFTGNLASYGSGYGTGLDGFYFGYCDSSLIVKNNKFYINSLYGDPLAIYYCEGSALSHAVVSGNMLICDAGGTTGLTYGIYAYYSDNAEIYHNSVYVNTTSASNRGIYVVGVAGDNYQVKNNIVYSAGSGYGLYFTNGVVGAADYNDVYTPGASNYGYVSSVSNTLAAWRAATGFGANSKDVDPGFMGSGDLHINCNVELDNAGTPVLEGVDRDGDVRGVTNPDIGADEFFTGTGFDLGVDVTKCAGASVQIGYGGSITNPVWNTGNTTNYISVVTPGTYTLSGTSACGAASDAITVTDIPGPVAAFTQSVSFMTVVLTDQTAGATGWNWDFGDGNGSTQQNPTHLYASGGDFTVTLTVTGPCGTDVTSQVVHLGMTGINESVFKDQIEVFPNPVQQQLTVGFKAWNQAGTTVEVLDMNGRVVNSVEFANKSGDFFVPIDMSTVNSGIYFVRVGTIGGSAQFKVSKQ